MVQSSCVQIAVTAVNESWAVRETRKGPSALCTRAMLPTVARGDAASIVSWAPPFDNVAITLGSCEIDPDEPPDGDVGLPPHACKSALPVAIYAA